MLCKTHVQDSRSLIVLWACFMQCAYVFSSELKEQPWGGITLAVATIVTTIYSKD